MYSNPKKYKGNTKSKQEHWFICRGNVCVKWLRTFPFTNFPGLSSCERPSHGARGRVIAAKKLPRRRHCVFRRHEERDLPAPGSEAANHSAQASCETR